jgi:hypothetical protein
VVEPLPSKHKVLSSNPSTEKERKKREMATEVAAASEAELTAKARADRWLP